MFDSTQLIHARRSAMKSLAHRIFAFCGVRVSHLPRSQPKGSNKYFNTGNLTPLQENSRELYEQFYSDHEALNDYYQGYRLAFYKAVSDQVKASGLQLDNRDVLDVGCGSGHLLEELHTWSVPRNTAGCDFSNESVRFSCKRFPCYHFFQHDIYDPLSELYDVILCTEVLEHLERPWLALNNLVSAVRPGGTLVLTVPNGRRDTAIEHVNFWSPESWAHFLARECPRVTVSTATLMDGRINFGLLH